MISISNISYFIGGRALYENASAFVKPKDKIGLIGLNGRGKSTLLKLIHGEYSLDAGSISKANDCTIGFLNQDLLSYQTEDSILTVAIGAFKEVVDIERQLEHIIKQLETEYSDELVSKLTKLQEKYEQLDGYTVQSKAEEILEGIGFVTADLHRPLKEFSGGWRMRVMLAKLLLEKPSLLMLDEPTNHLDLPSIEWVENYLRNYEGAVMVVSHDRQFLDNVTTKTIEVSQSQLFTYEGNYSFYLEEKELRQEIQQNAFENQQAKIRQTERFIERFKAKATKARQVQSRVKALERMDMIEEVVDDTAAVNFKFKFNQQPGRWIATLKDVSKSYGDLEILRHTSIAIERGDKIALVGANGKGKSTLLRIIAGTEPVEGERTIGYNVIPAFYAQHQLESLHVDNEILDEMKQAGSGKTEQELRNVLGCFLFSNEDQYKKIKVLSGGEKSRVALAKTLISEANFLLLDEPTNHLDFISENILIQALQQYAGTFLVVSHNRYFISQIANKIWYIEDKQIKEYPGTFDEYEYWRKKNETVAEPAKRETPPPPVKKEATPKSDDTEKKLKGLNKELKTVEASIESLEAEKALLENEMAKTEVYSDFERLKVAQEKFNTTSTALESATKRWEEILTEIDQLNG
ncbi:MAG TPA: ABC-F family ATP-binding cassette domain-containing protein [Cyclobacteriaceae bacterium]|nr:ABC-F family ATP-binding cassette domain-containing protein [Cyclobacteriaceae bacterium]HMV08899.1 ABC-F family ATP-binding cassette domain-containing protein [Cyclobacteriaceae bacterium]HMX00346.1 ABC-F family ATP-binding cassette domain-containing protein [Cyclobacteriaceae bacterium]HMX49655.1 ABC-F family ATP-binding cassette domain-containing protein [Cyclobacteriaceae bacterium]HMY93166.1 ABC-F family ATP-binding cassette domain-containing protein [Cyclobacteriaceae bacterium]